MVSLTAAARVASRWLSITVADAEARARALDGVDAVYVCDDRGFAVLVGRDLRPLVGEPGHALSALAADFLAGWRTDYGGDGAA